MSKAGAFQYLWIKYMFISEWKVRSAHTRISLDNWNWQHTTEKTNKIIKIEAIIRTLRVKKNGIKRMKKIGKGHVNGASGAFSTKSWNWLCLTLQQPVMQAAVAVATATAGDARMQKIRPISNLQTADQQLLWAKQILWDSTCHVVEIFCGWASCSGRLIFCPKGVASGSPQVWDARVSPDILKHYWSVCLSLAC